MGVPALPVSPKCLWAAAQQIFRRKLTGRDRVGGKMQAIDGSKMACFARRSVIPILYVAKQLGIIQLE